MDIGFLPFVLAGIVGCDAGIECNPRAEKSALTSSPFLQQASFSLLSRNFYLYRDYRSRHHIGKSYLSEWGQGFIAKFESGYTAGRIGFGLDVHAMLGIRLDSGRGRSGTRLFPVDSDGRARKAFSKFSGAVKIRLSQTELKYGMHFIDLPVLSTDTSRLLPESVEGTLLTSREIEGLEINAGHFTALSVIYQSGHDSMPYYFGTGLKKLDLIGASYRGGDNFKAALYHSDVKDYWKKHYLGLGYAIPCGNERTLNLDFNYYQVKSQGELNRILRIDSDSWSLAATFEHKPHALTVGYQRISGKGGMPLDVDGGNTIYLTNSAIFSDFNKEGEKSWRVGYRLDAASLGLPGFSFAASYTRGHDITPHLRDDGRLSKAREWERDITAIYSIPAGRLKGLTLKLQHIGYRPSGFNNALDEVRVVVDFPLTL